MREGDEPRGGGRQPDAASTRAPASMRHLERGLLLAIAAAFLAHLRPWSFLCDDAFISFRYARNLGQHGALTYNLAPHEPVEGYTNLLWVLILGLGDALGIGAERAAPVWTAAASLVTLALVALISAELRRRFGPSRPREPGAGRAFEWPDLLAPALLVAAPEFVVWGSGGLETSLAVCLSLAAIWLWLGGRVELAALAAAAAGLTRLDALLSVACFGLAWLVIVGLERRAEAREARPPIPWRRVLVAALVFAGPLLVQLMWRRAYYGAWLPNTWAVKQHGAALRDFHGLGYLQFWAARLRLVWLAPLVLLLRPRHLLLLAPILAQLYWAWSIGGDFMAYGRFLLPATTLLALLVGLALAEAREQLRARAWLPSPGPELAWSALALALLIGAVAQIPGRIQEDRDHALLHIDYEDLEASPGLEGVDAMHRFAAIRLAAGRSFAAAVPADTLITVGAAGAMPYASGLPAYDSYGLVDPGVVEVAEPQLEGARPGHQLRAPLDYMLSHEPDLLCHIGYAGTRPPPRSLTRRYRIGRQWTGWACVETGPIPDRRAEGGALPNHYYCCMRPRDRFLELDESKLERRER